jgi:hypothetical protein
MTRAPTTDTAAPAAQSEAMARSRSDRPSGECIVATAAAALTAAAVPRTAGAADFAPTVSGGTSRAKSGFEKTSSKVV